jgi:hypothetical protein
MQLSLIMRFLGIIPRNGWKRLCRSSDIRPNHSAAGFPHPSKQENTMATSNSPLAPDAETDIDGPEVFPPIKPLTELGVELPPEGEDDEPREAPDGLPEPA